MRTTILVTVLLLGQCSLADAGGRRCRDDRPCGPGVLNLFVPQGFFGADFRPACRRHDRCYAGRTDQRICDDRYERDMLRACRCSRFPMACRLTAKSMAAATRAFGHLYRTGDAVQSGGRRVQRMILR